DRDRSLLRLSRVNRWLLVSSLALTGLLTDVVAHAFPKKAHASTTAGGAHPARKPRSHRASPQRSSPSTGALRPPPQPPAATEAAEAPSEAAPEPSPEAVREPAPSSTPAEEAPRAAEAAPESQAEAEPTHEAEASAPVVSGGS